jgi:hypothetical protein
MLMRYVAASMYPAVSDNDVLDMPLVIPPEKEMAAISKGVDEAFRKFEEAGRLLREAVDQTEAAIEAGERGPDN